MSIRTLSNQQRIKLLAAATTTDSIRLADLNVRKYGTNRTSELRGVIGDSKEPFEKLYNDALEAL